MPVDLFVKKVIRFSPPWTVFFLSQEGDRQFEVLRGATLKMRKLPPARRRARFPFEKAPFLFFLPETHSG